MNENPYKSPSEPEGFHESKPRADWVDAVPGLAVIGVILLSPVIAMALPNFGILHWPVTLLCVGLMAAAAWGILRRIVG